jgi:reductive dehalogenase
MPENLTRREFFKEMGMLGTAAAAGSFVVGEREKLPVQKRPSWVKEVDKPTVEIDWDRIKRWDGSDSAFNPKYYGDKLDTLRALDRTNEQRGLDEELPGNDIRAHAIASGWGHGFANLSLSPNQFIGPGGRFDAEERAERNIPKWTGTPEEAAQLVTAAMRYYGASSVGFLKVEPGTTEKLIYAKDRDRKILEFDSSIDEPTETEEKRLIPDDCRTGIVFTVQMSRELWRRAPTELGASVSSMGYEIGGLVQARTQMFLKTLGYQAPGEVGRNALAIAPGFAVMAGLGEMARYNRLITPEYGPTVRVFKLLTNLDIAPTKPIDAGLMNFCRTCKKCAEMCPSKSLSFDTEPSWEVEGGFEGRPNNPGIKTWYDDAVKCRTYWYEVHTGCGICFAYCPFSQKNLASFHKLQNWAAGSFPALNKTMRSLDDLLYTPNWEDLGKPMKDPDAWYGLDLPEYGIDTTRGKKHGDLG